MSAAGDHLDIVLCHQLVLGQSFQQIQSGGADGASVFENGITELHRNMTMQAEILWVIYRTADPLKIISSNFENDHVSTSDCFLNSSWHSSLC